MKVEVVERRRFYKGKHRLFWEVRVDGKIAEVTLFDPTKAVEEMCKEIEKNGGKYSREDIKMDGIMNSTEEQL
jgi:hypothetical protein